MKERKNVDRLHQKAGTQKITELHGNLYEVKCLKCDFLYSRHEHQEVLSNMNPEWKFNFIFIFIQLSLFYYSKNRNKIK